MEDRYLVDGLISSARHDRNSRGVATHESGVSSLGAERDARDRSHCHLVLPSIPHTHSSSKVPAGVHGRLTRERLQRMYWLVGVRGRPVVARTTLAPSITTLLSLEEFLQIARDSHSAWH